MAAITRKDWVLGWVPSADFHNGDVRGLARMDNLTIDETGALTLTPGISDIYTFGGFPHTIFSKFFGPTKTRYTANSDGSITRNGSVLASGGSSTIAAFGASRGYVLITSGIVRKKDDGTNTYNLGIAAPGGPPGVANNVQPTTDLTAPGTSTSADADGTSFIATNTPALIVTDTTVTGSQTPLSEDGIYFNVRVGDTSKLKSVKIHFYLDSASSESDYYWYEWLNDSTSPFKKGLNAWTTLGATRGNFQRAGTSFDKDWTSVVGVQVFFEFTEVVTANLVNDIRAVGGILGPLNDTYDYVQVNVSNDGKYIAKSPEGPVAGEVFVSHGYTTITPHTAGIPSEVTHIWIYRRSTRNNTPYFGRPRDAVQTLDRYYKVLEIPAPFSATVDSMSDEDALREESLKLGLINVQSIPGDIISIVGDYNGRVLYLTYNEIYVSERENPDLVDPALILKLSGDSTTRNLWAIKTDTGRILIGTTTDIHELSGTLDDLLDGTIDAINRPLGVSHPPITSEVATYQGTLFYVSSQGITSLAGANSIIVSPQLNLLFQGAVRYGIAPVLVSPNDTIAAPICVSKNKLFVSLPLQDGTRRCFVYDFAKQYWHPYYTDPIALFTEEDGDIIAGYGGGSGNALREIYTYSVTNYPQDIHLRTFCDDDQLPRNRKDTFTLKVTADTGNVAVNVSIAKNGSEQYITVMSGVQFNGREEKLITIAETIGLGKTFSLKITGTALSTCKIYNFSIEYDARPEQLTYLRIPYTNVGTASRKRFVNFPFEIDTLNQECEFFPLIDGAIFAPTSLFTHDRKGTHIHYFDTEAVGTDIGGILCGLFEFYGVRYDEIISEKMPNPVTYLKIPQTDYGTPNRKRHSSYKFRINTRGAQVRFTPRIDGVDKSTLDFSTSEPQVVEYFFTTDTIGINIGGTLQSLSSPKTPFEFYGPITPQDLETLPPRLREFRIPENNFGVAAKKRIRTIPIVINTNGQDVTFTPYIDNVAGTSSTLNTAVKMTTYHYFETDAFGIDFSGDLVASSATPFECYGFGKLENVETLPVPKKYDQIGPLRFEKLAKFQALRIRIIATGASIPVKIFNEVEASNSDLQANSGEYSTTLVTTPNVDDVYEILLPKTVNGTVFRITLGGPNTSAFHRYDVTCKFVESGGEANPKWKKYA